VDYYTNVPSVSGFPQQNPFYVPQGGAPVLGVLLTAILGIAAALVLALIYTVFQVYVPFIYLNFFATAGFGAGIGAAVAMLAKFGKIRSPAVIVAITVCCTLFGVYAEWGFFPLVYYDNFHDLSGFHPLVMLEVGQELFQNGSWGLTANFQVTGWFLVLVWVTEAVVIFLCAIGVCANFDVAAQPFCDNCNRWTKTRKGISSFACTGGEEEWQRLKNGDMHAVDHLPRLSGNRLTFVRLDVAACPQCVDSTYLTANIVSHQTDANGRQTENLIAIFKHKTITPNDQEHLSQAGTTELPTND